MSGLGPLYRANKFQALRRDLEEESDHGNDEADDCSCGWWC